MQYVLQRRRDDNRATTRPVDIRAVVRVLAASAAASLLALDEREWRSRFPAWADKAGQRAALASYAHRQVCALAEEGPGGWDSEYSRDIWRLRNLGIIASASNAIATLRFGGISQPWLEDPGQAVDPVADQRRDQHVRLLPGHPRRHPVLRVRRPRRAVHGPHQADRDLLERYLASLHRELAATPGSCGAASGS